MIPLFTNVLIKPQEAEEKTSGGIYVPDLKKEKPQIGTVVAVGQGNKDEEILVQVGQKVIYRKWSGDRITETGEDLVMVEQKDILAIL